MWKKILTISLVLVMVFAFAACEEEAGGAGLPLAQEIVGGVTQSWQDVRTYQFDMDMTMDMAGEADGEAFEMTMVMDSSCVADIENAQMMMNMTANVTVPEEDEIEMGMEMYLIGGTMYMKMDVPVMGSMWMKSEIPEEYWEQMSQAEAQVELLEAALEAFQVEVIGSEKVGGVDCYVLQVTPDMEQLWQLAMQQAQWMGEMPDIEEGLLEEMFRDFSMKQWIAKDTYLVTKAEADMAMEITPEAMGSPEEEGLVTMDISMVMLFSNYNQPVSIVLPPEAEEAGEIPMFPMQD